VTIPDDMRVLRLEGIYKTFRGVYKMDHKVLSRAGILIDPAVAVLRRSEVLKNYLHIGHKNGVLGIPVAYVDMLGVRADRMDELWHGFRIRSCAVGYGQ
jgi:hypothetical protein